MKLKPETIEIQEKLADYCKTGKLENIPGLTKNRIYHYKRLTNNVVINTLEQAFPIAEEILTDSEWNGLVMDFIARNDSQTPQIWKLPYEFYEFVMKNNYQDTLKKPWLNDLLYFEWIEIEIHTMPDLPITKYLEKEISPSDILIFNPEHKIIKLNYPVHLYSVELALDKKANYFVLVFREQDTGNVRFMDLTILYAVLLEKLAAEQQAFGNALKEIAILFGIENGIVLENKIKSFIEELKNQRFYLGISVCY